MGIPRTSPFAIGDCLPSFTSSGISAAITMAVVAVFEMSIEKTIVTVIRPNRIRRGFVPHTSHA